MRKIVVFSMISLDGVMQSPGGPEEDASGGFKYGGWSMPYVDEVFGNRMDEEFSGPFDLLLGKRTYEIFAAYWPKHPGSIGTPFDKATKYVVSNEGAELTWEKSILIEDNVVAELKALKEKEGPMLQVHGSGRLIQTLLKNDLVDELRLRIFPITLGMGKRLFEEGTTPTVFELTDSTITSSGVIMANYKRTGELTVAAHGH